LPFTSVAVDCVGNVIVVPVDDAGGTITCQSDNGCVKY
jgi:hypothetical protein